MVIFSKSIKNTYGICLNNSDISVIDPKNGIIFWAPLVVAKNFNSNKYTYFCDEALIERSKDEFNLIFPLKKWNLEFEAMVALIKWLFKKFNLIHPKIITHSRFSFDNTYNKVWEDMYLQGGASDVKIINRIITVLVGSNISSDVNFILHLEDGVAEIGIVINNRILIGNTIFYAKSLTRELCYYIFNKYEVFIDENTSWGMFQKLASLYRPSGQVTISGKDKNSEYQTILITSEEVFPIIEKIFNDIATECYFQLQTLPYLQDNKNQIEEIYSKGLIITGNEASIKGIDTFLGQKLNIPIRIDHEPHLCGLKGLVRLMKTNL